MPRQSAIMLKPVEIRRALLQSWERDKSLKALTRIVPDLPSRVLYRFVHRHFERKRALIVQIQFDISDGRFDDMIEQCLRDAHTTSNLKLIEPGRV